MLYVLPMSRLHRDPGLEDLLFVSDAGKVFGGSLAAMRGWDGLGKLKARRHAMGGYCVCLGDALELAFDAERRAHVPR